MDREERLAKNIINQYMRKVIIQNKVDVDNIEELKIATRGYIENIKSDEMLYTLTNFDRIFNEIYETMKEVSEKEKKQESSDEFNKLRRSIKAARDNMSRKNEIIQTLQEKANKYNEIVEESKQYRKPNKKTLKYSEIKNGKVSEEKEIEWDR